MGIHFECSNKRTASYISPRWHYKLRKHCSFLFTFLLMLDLTSKYDNSRVLKALVRASGQKGVKG